MLPVSLLSDKKPENSHTQIRSISSWVGRIINGLLHGFSSATTSVIYFATRFFKRECPQNVFPTETSPKKISDTLVTNETTNKADELAKTFIKPQINSDTQTSNSTVPPKAESPKKAPINSQKKPDLAQNLTTKDKSAQKPSEPKPSKPKIGNPPAQQPKKLSRKERKAAGKAATAALMKELNINQKKEKKPAELPPEKPNFKQKKKKNHNPNSNGRKEDTIETFAKKTNNEGASTLCPVLFRVKDVPNDGNCFLHGALYRLNALFPTHPWVNKTINELRESAVDFAELHYNDTTSNLHKDTLNLTRAEINEYNEGRGNEVRKEFYKQILTLTETITNLEKTLPKDQFEIEAAPLKAQKIKLMDAQDIALSNCNISSEEFFTLSKKDGFWCAQMFAFSLSAILDLPIEIYESSLPNKPNIFNALNSINEPIKLLRINNNHYNEIINIS
ncbi:MAG: hypothetical protein H0W88_00780 [Parachlamydiaceae bacterium]|nr:hypothetical protein [Parachlamydiaceae bacterium]